MKKLISHSARFTFDGSIGTVSFKCIDGIPDQSSVIVNWAGMGFQFSACKEGLSNAVESAIDKELNSFYY